MTLANPSHTSAPCLSLLAKRWSGLGWLASAGGVRTLPGCAVIRRGSEGWEVAVTRELVLPGSPETVFAAVVAEDVLPKVLTGYGPVPAVVGTADRTGPWDVPGSSRTVLLADGGSAHEEVTDYRAGQYFAYRVSAFTNPLRLLVRHARGEWTFAPAAGGTRVCWTYTFVASNRLAAVPLAAVAQLLWRGYMDVCLGQFLRMLA